MSKKKMDKKCSINYKEILKLKTLKTSMRLEGKYFFGNSSDFYSK